MQIEINNLSKSYGKKQVLTNINLNLETGMFGLLGRNGAGKTTLMRILATLTEKSNGEVYMNGTSIRDVKTIRQMIGYLPQDFAIYPNMKVQEALDYIGILSEIPETIRKKRIQELIEKVNLVEKKSAKFKTLSGGMKRRFGIAQALLNEPQILIVDEPTAGLDPEERIRFRNLLVELAGNRIVILSTHIAGDVESTCEKVGILDKGRLIACSSVEQISGSAEGKVYLIDTKREEFERIKNQYTLLNMQPKGNQIVCRVLSDEKPNEPYEVTKATLEDGYMQILEGVK